MARMSRFSKTGGAVMKGTLEAVAAGCADSICSSGFRVCVSLTGVRG